MHSVLSIVKKQTINSRVINKTSLNRPNNLQATNCDVFLVVRLDIFVASEGKQWIVVMSRVSLTDDWRSTPGVRYNNPATRLEKNGGTPSDGFYRRRRRVGPITPIGGNSDTVLSADFKDLAPPESDWQQTDVLYAYMQRDVSTSWRWVFHSPILWVFLTDWENI